MFSGAAYAPLQAKLSQGDIIAGIPWGSVDAPLTVCRGDEHTGKARFGPPEKTRNPDAFAKGRIETVHLRAKRGAGVVVWHSCELDKFASKRQSPDKWFAGVAPVISATMLNEADRAIVRGFDKFSMFPLPAAPDGGVDEESFVDLRYIVPMKQSLLAQRVGTFSPEMLDAFCAHVFRFLTRRALATSATCPRCQQTLGYDDFAPKGKAEDD
jgi:hypothetical protein